MRFHIWIVAWINYWQSVQKLLFGIHFFVNTSHVTEIGAYQRSIYTMRFHIWNLAWINHWHISWKIAVWNKFLCEYEQRNRNRGILKTYLHDVIWYLNFDVNQLLAISWKIAVWKTFLCEYQQRNINRGILKTYLHDAIWYLNFSVNQLLVISSKIAVLNTFTLPLTL